MKTNYTKFLMLMILATTFSFAQQTVLIDFGDPALPTTTGNWNNTGSDNAAVVYATEAGDQPITDMINDTGASTGFDFAITMDFQYFNGSLGTQAATSGDALFCNDPLITRDYFFTQADDDNVAAFSISGLDDTKYYFFEIFANRKTTQNRETLYTATGANNGTATLNPGGTTAEGNLTNTALINNMQSTGGVITIQVERGAANQNNWSYITALKMVENASTNAVEDEILATDGVNVYPNPVVDVLNIDYKLNETGAVKLSITDITGRVIHTENTSENQAGTYSLKWNRESVASGVYFLQLQSGNSKVSKKVVLK